MNPDVPPQLGPLRRLFPDPWTGDWLTRKECAARHWERADLARTWRYRLKRLWKGCRTGTWLPTAYELERKAHWLADDSAWPSE